MELLGLRKPFSLRLVDILMLGIELGNEDMVRNMNIKEDILKSGKGIRK